MREEVVTRRDVVTCESGEERKFTSESVGHRECPCLIVARKKVRVRVNELHGGEGRRKRKSKKEGEGEGEEKRMDRTQTDWQLVRGGGYTGST